MFRHLAGSFLGLIVVLAALWALGHRADLLGPTGEPAGTLAEAKTWRTWRPGERLSREPAGKIPGDWFTAQRAYPATDLPAATVRAAMRDALTFDALHRAGGAGVWTPAGPTNVGGRITDVEADPADPSTIYAGSAAGGVFKSTDGGVDWTAIFDDQPFGAIGAIALDPSDASTIYVGTGEANAAGDTYSGDGVYKSTDAGTSWQHIGLEATAKIADIEIDPTDPQRVFVAAMGRLFSTNVERGLYRSEDGGASWTNVLFVDDSTGVVDVAIHPTDPDVVYAASWTRIRKPQYRLSGGLGSGIHKSTDGGDTWTRLGAAEGLPAQSSTIGRIGLAIAESSPSTVYAYYCDHPGYFLGVYKTTNGGASWSRVNDGAIDDVTSSFGWYFGQIRVAPSDADRVWVLGVPLYHSSNGGGSWDDLDSGVHVDHHALWINPTNPNQIYSGNDGGFYRTTNGGLSWTKSGNLPVTQFYAITVDPTNPERLYGGTQDNSTPRTLDGAPDGWDVIYYGDGFYTLVDPTDPNTIYAEYQYGGLGKSTNLGSSWSDATGGISGSDRRNWSTPVVMDPDDHNTLYYGTYRVYRTTNGASSWSSISGDLTNGDDPGSLVFGTITTIDVARTDPQTIMAGTDDGNVWITFDGGSSWNRVSDTLPDRWVTRVTIDPTNDQIAYVTLSGYKNDEYVPYVFRTGNGGLSWTDITSNLPPVPMNDILVDPEDPTRLYLAGDSGVYWSATTGASWAPLGSNLPPVPVYDLHLDDGSRTLVAGTHGRSMSTFDLDQIVVGVPTAPGVPALTVRAAPNPFATHTTLSVSLDAGGPVVVEIFDARGRLVRRLADRVVTAGEARFTWDGHDERGVELAAGTYFHRVHTASGVGVGKLLRRR